MLACWQWMKWQNKEMLINSKLKFKSWSLFLKPQRRIALDGTENRAYSFACSDSPMFRRIQNQKFLMENH